MAESKEICTIVPQGQEGFQPLVYGMGFLVNDREILTCAHVIEAALGKDWQTGDGKVQGCFPFSGTAEGEFVVASGHVDRARWFAKGDPKPGKPTDIAVILLEAPAPSPVKRGTLLDSSVQAGSTVKIYGFPGAKTAEGTFVSHPTGLHIEGKVIDDLPAGRGQFQGIWDIGTTVQGGFSGASVYDPARDSIVGMIVRADRDEETKIAEFIGAPSLRLALGSPATPPDAKNILETRSIPKPIYEQTIRRKREIEAYLEEIGKILPEPNADARFPRRIGEILFNRTDVARLRASFGFPGNEIDLRSLFQSMTDRVPAVPAPLGKMGPESGSVSMAVRIHTRLHRRRLGAGRSRTPERLTNDLQARSPRKAADLAGNFLGPQRWFSPDALHRIHAGR